MDIFETNKADDMTSCLSVKFAVVVSLKVFVSEGTLSLHIGLLSVFAAKLDILLNC